MPMRRLLLAAAVALAPVAVQAAEPTCLATPTPIAAPPAPLEADIEGRPTLRYFPAKAKGVVYLFHGSGGSERFATRIHSQRVISRLVAAGYGYVAAPSLDRTEVKRWNITSLDPAANPDVAYMLALHKALIAKGEITARTPVFTMGMSNGGAFANLFGAAAKAQSLPVTAVADYMGPFPMPMRVAPKALAPTFVVLAQNDGLVSTPQVSSAIARLTADGAQIESHVVEEQRACAASLTLVPGLSPAARQALVAETLPAAGVADAEGRRLVYRDKPSITREDMADLNQRLPRGAQGRDIGNELLIAWAAHQMRSDFADAQVAFFDKALAGAKR